MSTILSSDDLNDFIKPSVSCIKTFDKPSEKTRVDIDQDEPLEVFKDGTTKALEPAQISLSDCLACTGCITSAEEILVAQHSHKELLNALNTGKEKNMNFVASISPQSRSSLAMGFGVSIEMIDLALIDLLVNYLGFKYVVGTELGRLLSLKHSCTEIQEKKIKYPVLNSSCPGWVLYVEKTHPEMIPHLSKVRSPQSVTGKILKKTSSQELDVPYEKVYHLSIMPCFDKKLEAASNDDVDCVITAKELVQMMHEQSLDFNEFISKWHSKEKDINDVYESVSPKLFKFGVESWYSNLGTGSGGFAYQYLEFLKWQHKEKELEVVTIQGRNDDVVEYQLKAAGSDATLGSVAVVNGFRNIQNLIRKLNENKGTKRVLKRRTKRSGNASKESSVKASGVSCDFVEVMACPGGCINGGGQISSPEGGDEKQWMDSSLTKYKSISTIEQLWEGDLMQSLDKFLQEFCGFFGISEEEVMYGEFAKIESTIEESAVGLASGW